MRKEYRGQRSVDAFTNFIRAEMKPSIQEFHSKEDFTPDVSLFCSTFLRPFLKSSNFPVGPKNVLSTYSPFLLFNVLLIIVDERLINQIFRKGRRSY